MTKKPNVNKDADLSKLIDSIETLLDGLELEHVSQGDWVFWRDRIFEKAIDCFCGEDSWKWINEKRRQNQASNEMDDEMDDRQ